jgi:hypothetical protein
MTYDGTAPSGASWFCWGSGIGPADAAPPAAAKKRASKASPAEESVLRYVAAMAAGDKAAVGKLDFACAYRLAGGGSAPPRAFPPDTDPFYAACWESIGKAHAAVIQETEQGIDALWPGKGSLVMFEEDFARYAPSCFVMEALGASPPAGGILVEVLGSRKLTPASFRLSEDGPVLSAPATLVRLAVRYKDPLLSPVSYAPGSSRWTTTTKRPRQALKSLTLRWIVLSELKKLGFPADTAVLNLPVKEASATAPAVPFTAETGGYEPNSAQWWQPADAPGILIAAVGRAQLFPELHDRLAMLNRVLIIDPAQGEALTVMTRDLYAVLLRLAVRTHQVAVSDPALAEVFNELYWNTYAQTTRWDLSLGMEMGGLSQPTAADFLYRMLPAMQQLAKVRPQDLENRLHLGNAYRWNVDQRATIATHEALLGDVPPHRPAVRARVLNELAWSRIAKVAWNRTFSDTGIQQAYREAEEAYQLTDSPLDQFVARYTMAYSLLFMPERDNRKLLDLLMEAKTLYLALPGTSPASWLVSVEPRSAEDGAGCGPDLSAAPRGNGSWEVKEHAPAAVALLILLCPSVRYRLCIRASSEKYAAKAFIPPDAWPQSKYSFGAW